MNQKLFMLKFIIKFLLFEQLIKYLSIKIIQKFYNIIFNYHLGLLFIHLLILINLYLQH